MAKQLNVSLVLNADTNQAKKSLNELNQSLNQIINIRTVTINDQSIQKAKGAALELKQHLDAAVNVDTGKLDLGKFSQSLSKSGKSLQDLSNNLIGIGTSGQKAFLNLANTIASADASALTLSSRLSGLLTTLKNTARWQISSSILHGFMGAIQSAYGYAQDLNESLNNIRIVTGQSVDQMARFAEQANRAAKELSTTTTAYTDAALIYYQQGLDDKAVQERTNVTIKMANVSRQSAEEVSNQMTAIWNNFAKAGENLEYYADVITALGAATASSSEEISTGLEKFASIANTVGLSYEYATSALATITATTRQSADVVGTALKTLFARIQDLDLGKTLEDGVDLGKYSKALETIGVDVLDAVGNVRQMDDILDDMGEKWGNLTEAQKIATAETVAGQRQYAQLMALMDNWGFMQQNLQTARGSQGTLQKQADTYAESWEAAGKRVKASLENIYQELINDKAFVGMLNTFEKILTFIGQIIDGLGGLKGVLMVIGSIILDKYSKEIPALMTSIINNFSVLTGKAEQNRQAMLEYIQTQTRSMMSGVTSQENTAELTGMNEILRLKRELAAQEGILSQAEKAEYETKIQQIEAYTQSAAAIGKEIDKLKEQQAATKLSIQQDLSRSGNYNSRQTYRGTGSERLNLASALSGGRGVSGKEVLDIYVDVATELGKIQGILDQIVNKTNVWESKLKVVGNDSTGVENLKNEIQVYIKELEDAGIETTEFSAALANVKEDGTGLQEVINMLKDINVNDAIPNYQSELDSLHDTLVELGADEVKLEQLAEQFQKGEISGRQYKAALQEIASETGMTVQKTMELSEAIGRMGGVILQLSTAINGIKRIVDIWSDEDLSAGEKMLQTFMGLASIMPVVTTLLNAQKLAELGAAAARLLGIDAIVGVTAAEGASIPIKLASGAAGWVALGPLAALVGIAAAVIAAIIGITSALQKEKQQMQEAAEESKKTSEATKQEIEENQNLIKAYKEAIENQDDTLESKNKLSDAALAVAKKLKIENAELLIQTGQYDKLTEAINAANKAKLEQALLDNENAFEKNSGTFENDIREAGLNFGATGNSLSLLGKNVNDFDYLTFGQHGVSLNVDLDKPTQLMRAYEEVESHITNLQQYARENDLNLHTQVPYYDKLKKWLDDVSDSYKVLAELEEEHINLNLENQILEHGNIKNLDDYNRLLQDSIIYLQKRYFKFKDDAEGAKEAAEAYFALNSNLSDYVTQLRAREQLSEATGLSLGQLEFKRGNKDPTIYYQLSPDVFKSKKLLDAAYNTLQHHLDGEALNVEIQAVATGYNNWKKDMTVAEKSAFFADANNGFDNLGITQQDFLGLTFEQQQLKFIETELQDRVSQIQHLQQELNEVNNQITARRDLYGNIGDTNLKSTTVDNEQAIFNLQGQQESLNTNITEKTQELTDRMRELAFSYLDAASNLTEFNSRIQQLQQSEIEIDYQTIADGLIKLAENYDSCSGEVLKFQQALTSGSEAMMETAEAELRNSIRIAEMSEKLGINAESVEEQAKAMEDAGEAASTTALLNQSMNKGITSLAKNWETWKKTLAETNKTSQDYADTVLELKDSLASLLGITNKDFIPDGFLKMPGVMEKIEAAAQGDVQAINELGIMMAQATVEAWQFSEGLKDASGQAWDSTTFNTYKNEVLEGINALNEAIVNGTIQAGQDITSLMDGTGKSWAESLNEMAYITGMSVDEMNSLLNELGVQADVTTKTKNTKVDVPVYRTETTNFQEVTDEDGNRIGYSYDTTTRQVDTKQMDGSIEVAQINMGDKAGTPPTIHYAGRAEAAPSAVNAGSSGKGKSGGGGGGGSEPKHETKETKNINDELERYHWLNEELDDLQRDYDKVSKSKDRAFGKNRINLINQEIAALDKLIAHNQQYMKSIQANKVSDLNALMNGGITKTYTSADESGAQRQYMVQGLYDYGFGAESFDEHGNLVNYDSIVSAAVARYNAAVEYYNGLSASEQTAAAKDMLHEAELQYESLMELIQQYEETNNLYQDKLEEILESFRQQQDLRLEALQYELELKISFSDADLKRLDYERKMLKDDIFKAAEYLRTIWNSGGSESNWSVLQTRASDVMAHAEQVLNTSHGDIVIDGDGNVISNPDLSDEGWVEALRDVEDEIYNTIDSLWELDDTMCHYYEETLQDGEKRLDALMSKLEDCTKVLQHFQKISELLGKEQEFDWMNEILAGQRDTIKNELNAAKTEYAYAKQQYDNMMQRYNETKGMVDEGTRQKMEDELQAQYESMVKWQDKMYEKTEEYAEASIALYENMVKQQTKIMEDAMTGGMGFDSMLDSMKNVSSTQDMILTKTNQIYETNKLMRQIQQEMDKTNNQAAKARLQSFNAEIEDLQKRNTMSKFDLDIANARYKLLLAQIALEEAQNAKSTVRLQRDNQGNYGYVYTADRDKVENAQQAADDAGNDLYNLSLEKANENAQALIELDKELHDELERIAIEYRGNDEKIQEEQARVREEYAQKRKAIEEDYLTALYWLNETATTDISEAWSTKYQDMIVDTEDWQGIVDDCVRAVEEIYNEWKQDMDENVTPSVGENLDELKGKINEVLKESQTYEQWFNQFAADNARRLDEVSRLTNEYYKQRDAVMALIQSLMDYCAAIDAAIRAAAEMESAQQELNQTMNMPAPTVNTQPTNPDYTPPSGGGDTGTGSSSITTTEEKETGCFTADTKILMADFSEKNIIEVQKGDIVLAYNENKNYFEPKQVLGIFYQLKMKQIVKIYLNNGIVLRTTDSHPLLTTNGWKALDVEAANYFHGVKTTQLNLFDTIKGFESDGVVEKIEYITYEDCIPVFTLMVEDCHTFLADGMIVHNVATYTRPKYDYMTYATGGYTGEWTSNNDIASGKLAVLHQKELVLNQEDTENFLNAVKIVRMISQGIDLRAAAGNYGPGLGSPSFSAGNSAFEQQVTITAEFPNATDHSEIEQAFDDLMNRAAQFVGRPTVMPKRFETI